MPFSRINPRQWFWMLTAVAFVWALVGTRTASADGKPRSLLQETQRLIKVPIDIFVTPGRSIAWFAESALVGMAHHLTTARIENSTVTELRDHLTRLEEELAVKNQAIKTLQAQLAQVKAEAHVGLYAQDLVAARINGYSVGTGSSLVTIDKGTNHGIPSPGKKLVPVISEFRIVGRVAEAFPMTSSVRLLTDPRSPGVRARIIHRKDQSVAVENCFVKAAGNGQLVSESVEKNASSMRLQPGDVVHLADLDWPKQLQNFIVGHVVEVKEGDSPFRYTIRIAPAVALNKLQLVDVVVRY